MESLSLTFCSETSQIWKTSYFTLYFASYLWKTAGEAPDMKPGLGFWNEWKDTGSPLWQFQINWGNQYSTVRYWADNSRKVSLEDIQDYPDIGNSLRPTGVFHVFFLLGCAINPIAQLLCCYRNTMSEPHCSYWHPLSLLWTWVADVYLMPPSICHKKTKYTKAPNAYYGQIIPCFIGIIYKKQQLFW